MSPNPIAMLLFRYLRAHFVLCTAFLLTLGTGRAQVNAADPKPEQKGNQVNVSRTQGWIDGVDVVKTVISTPHIREEVRETPDGKLLVRILTATLSDDTTQTTSQTLFFVGESLQEVSSTHLDKATGTLTQTKYAPDGAFLCQSITKGSEPIVWRDESGTELSPEQLSEALKRGREKAIHLQMLVSAQGLADALAGSRDKLRANAQIEFAVLRWHFEGDGEPQGVAEFLALAEKTKFQPVAVSAEEAKAAAESYKSAVIGILGQTDVQRWKATFLDGSIKFEEEVDPERLKQLRDLAQAQNVTPRFDRRRQWLFTGQSVYAYGDGANVVTVSPLEPTTTAYPVRLDFLNPGFGTKSDLGSFLGKARPEQINGHPGFFSFESSRTSLLVSFDGGSVGLRAIAQGIPSASYWHRRFYSDLVGNVLSPALAPFAVTILERSEGSTEVLLFVLRSIQVGKVTADDMVLEVPK
jgi:hypothetical protein